MKKLLLRILDIKPEEFGPVNLLLTVSFFIGVFLVTFDVATSALFMDDSKLGQPMLAQAFMVSGVLGVLVSFVFVNLQKRISFGFLVKSTFIFIFLYVSILSYVLEVAQAEFKIDPEKNEDWFIQLKFFSFASLGPLNALAILSFYGIVTRAFNLKNQKRLTGTVDQGQMLATAIAFFTVPVLDSTFAYFKDDVIHYLFLSAPSIICALVGYIIYEKKYPSVELQKLNISNRNEIAAKFETFTKNPYVRLIGFIFLVSGIAAIFVDYSFLVLSSQKYHNDPSGFAIFLAYFGGVLTVFSLVLQIFIGDRLIETYGMKVALMILPLLLACFTMVSSLFGSFNIQDDGSFGESAAIMLVFIGLSKFFFQACRESFEEPIFKGFFLPIDKKIRHDIQAKIEGMFLQISVLVAGGVIFSLGTFFDLHHYTYLLFFIFAAYGYVVIKLHGEYQNTLKSTLAAQKVKGGGDSKSQFSVVETLKSEIKSNEEARVINSLKLMEKMDPVLAESILIGFAADSNPEIRKHAVKRIQELKLLSAEQSVRKISQTETSPIIKKLATEALEYIDNTENVPLSGPKLAALVKSKNPHDRDFAAKILSRASDDQGLLHLLLLMRDPNPTVRITAILSAGKSRNPELWPLLIESLSSSVFGNAAAGAITTIGENIMPSLEAAFHKTGQTLQTQLRIVQIYGKIGGEHAIDLLWPKIDYPSKKIRIQILHSLSNCGLRVLYEKSSTNEKLIKIKQTLETAIGNAAWNIAALSEVGAEEAMRPVRDALEEEIKNDYDLIFLLLSFMYDSESIRLVKENLDSGTMEGTLYAIELLDVFLEDDIQPMLFPLLDDISQEERSEKLQNYFPRESLDATQVLLHIVNRDYNHINRWTKACAIFGLAIAPGYKVTDDLIANLFNPDPLLRETAAWVIYYLDKEVYHTASDRLNEKVRKDLDAIITKPRESVELRMERVVRLKETPLFSKVPGVVLADLEEIMETIHVSKGDVLLEAGENGECPILIIREGEAGLYDKEQLIRLSEPGEVLGRSAILETDFIPYTIVAQSDMRIYKVEKDRFFELMGNNYELVREFVGSSGNKTPDKNEVEPVKS